ncbi:UbiA family prenyltransferase [Micromonospora sp. WMMD1102]|uniref:UbiA family prenyltransferase n=1 Tax=Micromonospora sp. WMMD1102 TaxID=3016105 RepID=UPI0024155FAF|nr:UbiA family prenyltransferase [Micromonospora sp. WMMD1102]MDG4784844.1 UbiA family prenyltransferase [Micromonospora sp. WMMD1102]
MSVLSEVLPAPLPAAVFRELFRAVRLAWIESRPTVQVMFQLRFLAGALLGLAGFAAVPGRVLTPGALAGVGIGALAWLCATWHIYLLNGLCDQVEDRHNRSGRPLASGALPLRAARTVAAGLAVAALGCAALLSWPMVLVVLGMLGLGWAYSAGPRPQKANVYGFVLVVTAGGLLTYLAGWLAAGGVAALGGGLPPLPPLPLLVLATAMSLWMSLGGMTKDLSDVAGDRAAGRRTLPVVLGDRRARRLMAVLAVGVGAGLCLVASARVPELLPAGVVLLLGGGTVASCLAAPVPPTRSGASLPARLAAMVSGRPGEASVQFGRNRLRLPYRAFMVTQYGVHGTVLGQCLL